MMNAKIGKLPLVQDGKLVGLYSYSDVRALIEEEHPCYNRDSQYRLRAGAAVGPNDQARVEAIANENVDVIVVDSAHGHTKGIMDMVSWISSHYTLKSISLPETSAQRKARSPCVTAGPTR